MEAPAPKMVANLRRTMNVRRQSHPQAVKMREEQLPYGMQTRWEQGWWISLAKGQRLSWRRGSSDRLPLRLMQLRKKCSKIDAQ